MAKKTKKKALTEKPRRSRGRESTYSNALADRICNEIANNAEGLRSICKRNPDFPHKRTLMTWLATEDEKFDYFRLQYARAREQQADLLAEETLEISDDGRRDYKEIADGNGTVRTIVDHDHISRARLRVDTRKWLAGKLAPKVYGDKLQHTGEGGGPIRSIVTEVIKSMEDADTGVGPAKSRRDKTKS